MKVFMLDPSKYTPPYDYGLCNALCEKVDLTFFSSKFQYDDEIPGKHYKERMFFFNKTNKMFGLRKSRFSRVFKALEYFFNILSFFKVVVREKPDVVHWQWLVIPRLDILIVKSIRVLGVKCVYTAHNAQPHDVSNINKKFYKKMYGIWDHVICHTEETRKNIVKISLIGSEKISVIPHGDFSYLRKYEVKKVPELDDWADKDVLMFFGLVKPYKNVEFVLNSLPELLKKNNNARFAVVGKADAEYLKLLLANVEKNKISDYVKFINDYIPDSLISSYINYANLLVFPYKKIYQSGALLMALELGKVVISSDLKAFKESIHDGENGFIYTSGDNEEFIKKVGGYFSGEVKMLEEVIKARVGNSESWGNIADSTLLVYRQQVCGVA